MSHTPRQSFREASGPAALSRGGGRAARQFLEVPTLSGAVSPRVARNAPFVSEVPRAALVRRCSRLPVRSTGAWLRYSSTSPRLILGADRAESAAPLRTGRMESDGGRQHPQ